MQDLINRAAPTDHIVLNISKFSAVVKIEDVFAH